MPCANGEIIIAFKLKQIPWKPKALCQNRAPSFFLFFIYSISGSKLPKCFSRRFCSPFRSGRFPHWNRIDEAFCPLVKGFQKCADLTPSLLFKFFRHILQQFPDGQMLGTGPLALPAADTVAGLPVPQAHIVIVDRMAGKAAAAPVSASRCVSLFVSIFYRLKLPLLQARKGTPRQMTKSPAVISAAGPAGQWKANQDILLSMTAPRTARRALPAVKRRTAAVRT